MYREMRPEEKLEYSAEVIEAIKNGGLVASLEVVEKYKKLLIINNKENDLTNEQNNTPVEEVKQEEIFATSNVIGEASIYAEEHIPAVQDDLREQGLVKETEPKSLEEPKARVLTPLKSTTPNPWGESKIVLPGELNL